jgi:hypothetical protein
MRKTYFLIVSFVLTANFSFAQWTTSGSNIYNSNTGNVGIGTTSPAATLDVNGDLAIKGTVVNSMYSIPVITDGTYVIASGSRVKGTYTVNFETGYRIQTVVLVANGTQYDGNSTLSILSNTSYAGSVVMSNFRFAFNSDNSIIYLLFDIANRNSGALVTVKFDGNGYNANYGPNWGGTLPASPTTCGVYPLVINQGSVSIGTANAKGYQFAVNGSAIATAMTVKLNANWPDYVFKKEYQLQPLIQLQAFIDQNHHLPEMPSEQDVAKDGINLGEMDKLLTKKVEELTLYIIEKDQKDNQQQQQIDTQKEQLNDEKQIVSKQLARIDSQENQLKSQQAQIDLLIKQVAQITNEKSK